MKIKIIKTIPYRGMNTDLVKKTGIPHKKISLLLRRLQPMTINDAHKLSRATGLPVEHWFCPKKYRNPYIKQNDRW